MDFPKTQPTLESMPDPKAEGKPTATAERPPQRDRSVLWSRIALFSILALAAFVRFYGISRGCADNLFVHDEIIEVHRAFSLLNADPEGIPGPKGFFFFFLAAEYGVWGLYSLATGAHESFADFTAHALAFPGTSILLGRVTSAVLGVISVWLLYLFGRRAFRHRGAGLALASAWATCWLAAWQSHQASIEPCFVTMAILSLLAVQRLDRRRRFRDYAFVAIAVAMAAACKTYGLGLLLLLWMTHVARDGRWPRPSEIFSRLRESRIWLATALFGLVYVAIAPMMVVHFLDAAGVTQSDKVFFPPSDLPKQIAIVPYTEAIRWNLGNLTLIFLAAGVISSLRSFRLVLIASLAYATVHLCVLGLIPTNVFIYPRYMLVTLPFLFAVSVWGALRVAHLGASLTKLPKPVCDAVVLVAFVVITAVNGIESLIDNQLFRTRGSSIETVASNWFEENVAPGSKVLLETRSIFPAHSRVPLWDLENKYRDLATAVERGEKHVRYALAIDTLARVEKSPRYDLEAVGQQDKWLTLDEYIGRGVQYFVIDTTTWSQRSSETNDSRVRLYGELETSPRVVHLEEFKGADFKGIDEHLVVYKVK